MGDDVNVVPVAPVVQPVASVVQGAPVVQKKSKMWLWIVLGIVLVGILTGGYFVFFGDSEPQQIKINSLSITDVFRDCEKSGDGSYRDITIQTTIDIDAEVSEKYSIKLDSEDCSLKMGSDEKDLSLNRIPTPQPYVEGIESSGLHMVTGGELDGDESGILTICCQEKCDTANINVCE